ncbi:MAG TPA: DegT/DnrJ/EryC1/StrS family aminotransferase, partial [Candidatus Cloacimonas sp.]|nr:DegT/DnrJ/EryC1/StrS family aminotransferase [Candidatus Cloacimonas sp.]
MSYKIPLFDLNFDDAEAQAAYDVIKSGWISTGPKCLDLEEKFASMLNVKYACSVTNCTVALHLAMV